MTHDWTLTRHPANGQAVLGVLDFGGGLPCVSLERLAVMIPEGRYRVVLTVSGRASRGALWAPYPDSKLPLLEDVPPGRSAIRIHAGNHAMESAGCILVGSEHDATEIQHSRPALTRVVNILRDAEQSEDEVWLTVRSGA